MQGSYQFRLVMKSMDRNVTEYNTETLYKHYKSILHRKKINR